MGVSRKSFGGLESSRKSDTCWLIPYASLPSRKATIGRIQGTFKSKTIQSKTGELDAFSRYFLPALYSDKGKMADFVAPQLTIDRQAGQLQSVILESSLIVDEATYKLTYVVAVKDGENRSQKRLVVTVKEEPSAPYGFQVIAEARTIQLSKIKEVLHGSRKVSHSLALKGKVTLEMTIQALYAPSQKPTMTRNNIRQRIELLKVRHVLMTLWPPNQKDVEKLLNSEVHLAKLKYYLEEYKIGFTYHQKDGATYLFFETKIAPW